MYTKIVSKVLGKILAKMLAFAIVGLVIALVSCVDDSTPSSDTDSAPPEVVTLSSKVIGDGRVELTWTDPADADFSHVIITWTPTGGTTAQPLRINKGDQKATIEGLDAATSYAFSATSVDATGNVSDSSAPVSVTPDATAPASVTALTGGAPSNGEVALTWTDPADADFSHVLIRWTPEGGTTAQPLRVNKGDQRATIEGLDAATRYTFSVTSVDTNNIESASGASASISVTPDATAPASVTALAGSVPGDGEVTLTWTNPTDADFSHVIITWTPAGGTTTQPLRVDEDAQQTMQQTTIEGLDAATEYTFSVTSVDDNDVESASSAVTVTPDNTPPARVTLSASAPADGQVTLTWTDPADADFLHVIITWTPTGGTPTPAQPLTVPKNAQQPMQQTTIEGLDAATEYTFSATSVDTNGNVSDGSESVAITPDGTAPALVTLSASAPADGQVTLTWTDPGDADFSHVLITWTPTGGTPAQPLMVAEGTGRASIEGLDAATEYTFSAASVDDNGNVSDGSAASPITPDITAPATVTLSASATADGEVTLTWTDPPADADFSHLLIRWTPSGGSATQPLRIDAGVQTATITGFTTTAMYTFSARSVDRLDHTSVAGPSSSVRVGNILPPAGVSAFRGHPNSNGTSLRVYWEDPSDTDLAKVAITYQRGTLNRTVEVNRGVGTLLLTSLATGGTAYSLTATAVDSAGNRSASTSALRIGTGPYVAIWTIGFREGNFTYDACKNFLSGSSLLATDLRNRGIAKAVFFGSTNTYNFVNMETDSDALPGSGSSTVRTYVEDAGTIVETTVFGAANTKRTFHGVVEVDAAGVYPSGGGDVLVPFGISTRSRFWSFTSNRVLNGGATCNHASSNSSSHDGGVGDNIQIDSMPDPGTSGSKTRRCDGIARVVCAGQ